MLTAIRESDNKKIIGNFILKDETQVYHCPGCGETVRHYKSMYGPQVGHFKHIPGSNCSWGKGQSMLHLSTILQIYTYLKQRFNSIKNLEIEEELCERKSRADIYIETNKGCRIAIEVQVSNLTVDEIIRRTKNYTRAGIYVLWVLPYIKQRFREGTVRLKEYELFLNLSNSGQLFFWEEKLSPQKGFLVLTMLDLYTEESYSEVVKEIYYKRPRLKIYQKVLDQKSIIFLSLKDLIPRKLKEERRTGRPYSLPERLVLMPRLS